MSGSGPMNVFDIAGRAMSAQLVRLNATASNMANAGNVTGSAYITQGIHLIQVKNIDLQFPGYQGPDSPQGQRQVVYSTNTTSMTSD